MDFDEYDYLEKTVENPESQKLEEVVNGGVQPFKSGGKDRSQSSRRRDEGDDDIGHKSKGFRSGDDPRDRDHHREKGSSRRRSRSREGERSEKDGDRHRSNREHRDRVREREERNGRDHERDRDGDKDWERRRERDRDRDRDHERKQHDREKEIERGRGEREHRSRSHSVRHREEKEGSRDREGREKSQDRELREKESRRHKEKKDEATEPEVDPERDQRTVFAYQLPLRADERDIFEFFSRAGKVRDVRLIMDRNSRRSKGVGYVEFYDAMSVPMAIALSGQPIRGQPVMVKPSEAEKNLVQSTSTTAAGAGGLTGSGPARRLYVGNLVPNITEEQLRVVFESFGTIELVQLPRDETGLCKGFAFVQFARLEDAKAAQNLNGQLDIGGRLIKVSAVTDQPGMQEAGAAAGDLDDDEGGGLALNASSRALLMQKLDRSGVASSIAGSLSSPAVSSSVVPAPVLGGASGVAPAVASLTQASVAPLGGLHLAGFSVPSLTNPTIDTVGVATECLLLKNMFDPKSETEPDFDLDIKEDVQDECAKFGKLKHIFVDKNSEGFVYLRFDSTQAAVDAQRALHGRWFAGKMIIATFMLPQNYEAQFPDSRE